MKSIFWHRRDLRIDDNAGLYKALKESDSVIPVFIFDTTILSKLPKDDQRVIFIHQEISELKKEYANQGADLFVYQGNPIELLPQLAKEFNVTSVYTNRDYEPLALDRDIQVFKKLESLKISFLGAKDHVIFEKSEVMKLDNSPYTIFTPYSKKWKEKLTDFYLKPYPTVKYVDNLMKFKETSDLVSLKELGFETNLKAQFPTKEFVDYLKVD